MCLSDYHNPKRLENIAERLKFQFNGFNYKLPRYFKEKIIKPKSLLSSQLAYILLQKSCDLYNKQLEQIRASRNCSEIEAFRVLDLQTSNDTKQLEQNAKDSIARFYNKSKI